MCARELSCARHRKRNRIHSKRTHARRDRHVPVQRWIQAIHWRNLDPYVRTGHAVDRDTTELLANHLQCLEQSCKRDSVGTASAVWRDCNLWLQHGV
jgi:methylase of polypeptide subunit release factors